MSRSFGKFQIESELGSGAMGAVWKAWDTVLRRPVALKFLTQSLAASADARQRFLRGDARAASMLHHPNIATVYEAGEEGGELYIAYELVEGETVRQSLLRGPLKPSKAAHIARGVAEGLAHAHEKGVLHRDVTSGNVMVNSEGNGVLVDFGLAKGPGASDVTMTGLRVGTLAYLAPEILNDKEVDGRSDLYGLGVVLYEMVTGRLPFIADQVEALQYQILQAGAEDPSDLIKTIPDELDRIIAKLMEKDPNRRYKTGNDVAADLAKLEASGRLEEADKRQESDNPLIQWAATARRRFRRALRFFARAPRAIKISFASLLLMAVYLGIAFPANFWPFSKRLATTTIAVLPLENQSSDPGETRHLVDGIAMALVNRLSKLPDIKVLPWIVTRHYDVEGLAPAEIASELGVDVLLMGNAHVGDDQIATRISLIDGAKGWQLWGESFNAGIKNIFDVENDIAQGVARELKGKITAEERAQLAKNVSEDFDAYELYLRGSLAVSKGDQQSLANGISYFQQALELDPELTEAHVGIGTVQNARYYNGWIGEEGLEIAENSFLNALRQEPKLSTARRGLVRVYWEFGESEECLKVAAGQPIENAFDVDAMSVWVDAYVFSGLGESALPHLKRIIELEPDNESAHFMFCFANWTADLNEEVIKAGEIFLEKFETDHTIHYLMGSAYESIGQVEDARFHFEEALRLQIGSPYLWMFLEAGLFYEGIGEKERAIELFQEGLDEVDYRYVANPSNLRILAQRACYHAHLGHVEDFSQDSEEVMTNRDRRGIKLAVPILALAEWRLGNEERAMDLLEMSVDAPIVDAHIFLFREIGPMAVSDNPRMAAIREDFEARRQELIAKY